MIFVDSSVWIDFFNGRVNTKTQFLLDALGERKIITGDVVLTEVLQGFREQREYDKGLAYLKLVPWVEVLGVAASVDAANNYRKLRRQGITVRKTIDVIIATYCIRHNHSLLHSDKDFDLMRDCLGLEMAV